MSQFPSTPSPRDRAAAVQAAASALADALYEIDASPEAGLLKDEATLQGATRALAHQVAGRTARLWEQYPTVRSTVDQYAAAAIKGDKNAFAHLAPVEGIVSALQSDVAAVREAIAQVGEAWRRLLPVVDRLDQELKTAAAAAADLGYDGDPELDAAGRALDGLRGQVATDPLGSQSAAAEAAVHAAATRLRDLQDRKASLAADLAAAKRTLQQITATIAEGGTALEVTRGKIANPPGLLQALDPAGLEDGGRGLRPWLERLEQAAASGEWLAAVNGLAGWRHVADGWLANATAVRDANQAPVQERDELRGLLDAYRAKAAAIGKAEDMDIDARYQQAHDVLWRAPCDLSLAQRLVREFGTAVNGAGTATKS